MNQKQPVRDDFHKIRQRLLDAGYREKDVTFSTGRAACLGLLCALPFAALPLLTYRLTLVHQAHLAGHLRPLLLYRPGFDRRLLGLRP